MIYTLTLNPAIDHIVRLKRVDAGETNRMEAESYKAGGKGINVSKILNNLGEESIALGFIAGFTGNEIKRSLEEDEGIKTDFVKLNKGFTRINCKIKSDLETEINGPGLDLEEADVDKLLEKLDNINDGDYLFLSGNLPSSLPKDFYGTIMKRLAEKDIHIIVDTAGPALKAALPFKPFLVKPNKRELEDFFSIEINDDKGIEEGAEKLRAAGARNIIVSLGADGAYMLAESGESAFLDAPKGHLIDTVGSGDSMVAGFVYGMKHDFSPMEAFKFSVSCGSATAFSVDMASKEDIEKIYKNL